MSIKSPIESLLFISNKPLSVKQLAQIFNCKNEEILMIMDELTEKYNNENSGIHILRHKSWTSGGTKFQMSTNPVNASVVGEFIKEEMSGELTKPSLETLTIIAYRGPISKTEIEQIRGVNCSLILKNLLLRGLVEVREDKEKMADYYNFTPEFLRHLGIDKIEELPDYERLSGSEVIDEMLLGETNHEFVIH